MYNTNIPSNQELPSTGKLIKSTILAAVAAGALLVTVVLPAEYGIDPTGIGETIGLKKMGEIRISLAEEAAEEVAEELAAKKTATLAVAEATSNTISTKVDDAITTTETALAETKAPVVVAEEIQPATNILNHEMQITLKPNEGTEIKVKMDKQKQVSYLWWTDGGRANFDIHGDSKALKIKYHNYSKGSEQKSEGVLEAAFDGYHGWFWRNRTSETLTVTLQTNGEYSEIIHVK